VVAVAFPEAETVFIEEHETANPLDGFPCVEMRNNEAERAAVFGGEWLAVMVESEEHVWAEQIGERDVGGEPSSARTRTYLAAGLG